MKNRVVAFARSLGFANVGVTAARPLLQHGQALQDWLAQGYEGSMRYMAKDPHRRWDPDQLLKGAQSIIALVMPYRHQPNSEIRIARYALGRDYHTVIGKRLDAFVRYLETFGPEVQSKTFVDAGPLLERPFAQQAGLGFIGKNAMLITKGLGSWVFLAHVVTTLALPTDAPDLRSCGSCRLCLDACPTEAIVEPYRIDARRCISYLTIENKEAIAPELRLKTNGWVFGCDICQEVCPHNRVVRDVGLDLESLWGKPPALRLADLLGLSEDDFRVRMRGTPLLRAGRAGLIRNACVAAAVLKRRDLQPLLSHLVVSDPDPIVREHAAWACAQFDSDSTTSPSQV